MKGPLWIDPGETSFPAVDGDIHVDVAVVGAGFSGLGAAWALRNEDVTVAVLEARTVASGASGRNAGFVLAGPAQGFAEAASRIGTDETLGIWALTRRNHDILVQIMEDFSIECGYLRRGSISLAANSEEWHAMLQDLTVMQAAGIDACRIEQSLLPVPFDRMFHGGIYFAGNGEIEPGRFLRGLAAHISDRIAVYENSRVSAIHHEGAWTLSCQEATVTADRVVVATNAYTAGLLQVPIAPTRGQVLATEPIGRVIVPFPMYADRGFQYWRQTTSGRLVLGGWRNLDLAAEVGEDETIHALIHQALDRFVEDVHAVHGLFLRIEHRWAGIMGFTPDHMPLVGRFPGMDGVAIAAGYSGHGVAMAFTCGMLAAQAVMEQQPPIPPAFDPARFV